MGIIESYRKRRAELTGPESVGTLELMQEYFQDGANWTQSMYENANGARCLVAAANHVRVASIDDAKHWLRLAIAEIDPGITRIEDFNDTRSTFAEVAAVIERAKQLAVESIARALPPPPVRALPAPVVEILPPQRQAQPVVALNPAAASPEWARQLARFRRRDRLMAMASWVME